MHFLRILCEFPGAASNRPPQALGLQLFYCISGDFKVNVPPTFSEAQGVRIEVGAMTCPATPASGCFLASLSQASILQSSHLHQLTPHIVMLHAFHRDICLGFRVPLYNQVHFILTSLKVVKTLFLNSVAFTGTKH